MADFTMCKDGECSVREKCHRFTATPSHYQSYFLNYERDGENCKYYLSKRGELK